MMSVRDVIDNIENSDYEVFISRRGNDPERLWGVSISKREDSKGQSVSVSSTGRSLSATLEALFAQLEAINKLQEFFAYPPPPTGELTDDDIPF